MPHSTSTVRRLPRVLALAPEEDVHDAMTRVDREELHAIRRHLLGDALGDTVRDVLDGCAAGTLHVQDLGPVDAASAQLLLHANGGRPRFVCEAGCAVAAAARAGRRAVLEVPIVDGERDAALALTGRLRELGTDRVDEAQMCVFGLDVGAVRVLDPSIAAGADPSGQAGPGAP